MVPHFSFLRSTLLYFFEPLCFSVFDMNPPPLYSLSPIYLVVVVKKYNYKLLSKYNFDGQNFDGQNLTEWEMKNGKVLGGILEEG